MTSSLRQEDLCCDKDFVNKMSIPGRICRKKKAHVTTNELGRKQKFCRDKVSSVMIRI